MKNIPLQLAVFCSGFLLCLFLTKGGCVDTDSAKDYVFVSDTVYVKDLNAVAFDYRDTIYLSKSIYKTRYVPVTDTLVKLLIESYPEYVLIRDTNEQTIPINEYTDSAVGVDYKVRWTSLVHGQLLTMDAKVETFYSPPPQVLAKKNKYWTGGLGIGVTNKGNLASKVSFGYRGWLVEPVFDTDFKYDRIYVTKQFNF